MASLTSGLIPIPGSGSGGKATEAKRNDLTGGLISLGGNSVTRHASDDVDFSDFDVDDLLLDDVGRGKSKSTKSGKSKSSKSKAKSPPSSPTAKSSASTKKTSSSISSSSSKKKVEQHTKEKKKRDDVDDKYDDMDRESPSRGSSWDDPKPKFNTFDVDAITAPVKKSALLDDEFARMLGLEDEFSTLQPRASATRDRYVDGDDHETLASPTPDEAPAAYSFSRGDASEKEQAPMEEDAAIVNGAGSSDVADAPDGLNASFFEDNRSTKLDDAGDDPFLSFLTSSTTQRRSGRGTAARRQAPSSLFADPFEKGDVESRARSKPSGLDDLFASAPSSSPSAGREDVSTQQRPSSASRSTLDSLFGSGRAKSDDAGNAVKLEEEATARLGRRSISPVGPTAATTHKAKAGTSTSMGSAKDDLLAELFPSGTRDTAPIKTPTNNSNALVNTLPKPNETPLQDDLLAELFPSDKESGVRLQPPQVPAPRESTPLPAKERASSEPEPPLAFSSREHELDRGLVFPSASSTVSSRIIDSQPRARNDAPSKAAVALTDTESARDSLLKDLLPESPQRSRRRHAGAPSPTALDAGTAIPSKRTDSAHPAGASEPVEERVTNQNGSPARPLSAVPTTTPALPPSVATAATTITPEPAPSPGMNNTLVLGTPSTAREVEFEQSKDDLLDEILASPVPSPSRTRRSSYSLSFDHDAPISTTVAHTQAEDDAPSSLTTSNLAISPSRRRSRSPDRCDGASLEDVPSTATARSTSAGTSGRHETVFLRDTRAEDELRHEHAAAMAALRKRHVDELAAHTLELKALERDLDDVRQRAATLASQLQHAQQDTDRVQTQLRATQADHARVQGELQACQTAHAVQQTQLAIFDREKEHLQAQLRKADDQSRALLTELTHEKQALQSVQLQFAQFQRDKEQEEQLQTHKERQQMDRLYHQLQSSLVQLSMLQEQVAGDEGSRREVENASRMRMISSLEATSRAYAQQTGDECQRLTSLLSSLETTLRHYRQEHLEEKERLRQEQARLDVLAAHFRAQTSVLHEKADANAQQLATYLGASLQDVRVAEARLAARRTKLDEDERQLHEERTQWATFREDAQAQHVADAERIQHERAQIEREWRELQRERDDLDDVIASHEADFSALCETQRALDAEKERVAAGALHVASMAQHFEQFAQQLVEKERGVAQEREAIEAQRREWAAREGAMGNNRKKIEEREARLHAQLKQMEKARRRLNEERKQQMQWSAASASSNRAAAAAGVAPVKTTSASVCSRQPASCDVPAAVAPHWRHPNGGAFSTESAVRSHVTMARSHSVNFNGPLAPATVPAPMPASSDPALEQPLWRDPSGLSPAFRQLIEDNWRNQQWQLDLADAALHKERMWIHCIGLDSSSGETSSPEVNTADVRKRAPLRQSLAGSSSTNAKTTTVMRTRVNGAPPPLPPSIKRGPPVAASAQASGLAPQVSVRL